MAVNHFKINLFNILHAKYRKTKSLDRHDARLYTPILLLERRNPSWYWSEGREPLRV